MMSDLFITQAAGAFGAGLLSSLSPCVYPMIPISIGFFGSLTGVHQKISIGLFVVGQFLAFTGLGIVATKVGEIFGFSHELGWVNVLMGTAMLLFGLVSMTSFLPGIAHRWNGLSRRLHTAEVHDYLLPVFVGMGSALLASPCTTPVLGTVLLTLSQDGSFVRGVSLMASYSLGVSLIFLILGLGFVAAERMPRAGKWMAHMHLLSSLLIVGLGTYYIYRGLVAGA